MRSRTTLADHLPHAHRAGRPHKQDTAAAHGSPLGEEEVRLTKRAYGWPEERAVLRARGGAARISERVRERGAELYGEWQERLRAYRPRASRARERARAADPAASCPTGWDEEVPRFHATGTMTATRKSSHAVLQWAAARVPELVGGSADLAPSTLTRDRRRRTTSSPAPTPGETSTSGSASTRWARSSTG